MDRSTSRDFQGLHALFTGEDDSLEAWLSVDTTGISFVLGFRGSRVKLQRGFALPEAPQPTQDERRQHKEEEMDDYASKDTCLNEQDLASLLANNTTIQSLKLDCSRLVDDAGIEFLIKSSLEHLTLYNCETLSSDLLVNIGQQCSSLRSLELELGRTIDLGTWHITMGASATSGRVQSSGGSIQALYIGFVAERDARHLLEVEIGGVNRPSAHGLHHESFTGSDFRFLGDHHRLEASNSYRLVLSETNTVRRKSDGGRAVMLEDQLASNKANLKGKGNAENGDENTPQEESRILKNLFEANGSYSAVDHDAILAVSEKEKLMVDQEAGRVTQRAADKLRRYRMLRASDNIAVPT